MKPLLHQQANSDISIIDNMIEAPVAYAERGEAVRKFLLD